jgi:hypothetical protein
MYYYICIIMYVLLCMYYYVCIIIYVLLYMYYYVCIIKAGTLIYIRELAILNFCEYHTNNVNTKVLNLFFNILS